MRQTRREVIQIGALATAAGWLSGCKTIEQQLTSGQITQPELGDLPTPSVEVRMLNRAAFGVTPNDISLIRSIGTIQWVNQQLAAELPESPVLSVRLRELSDTLNADPGILFDIDDHAAVRTLRQATILRAVYSRNQLFERMVHFWTDHFNIYAYKNEGAQYKLIDDREIIRKHALGNFGDLLKASAKSAGMLGYLDGNKNVKGRPNENYARELFELHTLGIGGGYTQADIHNAARCFTGWRTKRHWHRGAFEFDPSLHDNGSKRVLGVVIPAGGGVIDGEQVLSLAANHPSTARHIATKLCLYFAGIAPSNLVSRLASTFLRTSGEIRPVLRELLLSPELASSPPMFKRPIDFVVSALRATGSDTDGGYAVQSHLAAMGQPLFEWPMPDGFPMRESAWVSGLIPRWRFAAALSSNAVENTSIDWDGLEVSLNLTRLSAARGSVNMLFNAPNADLEHQLAGFADIREAATVAMMSPYFQYR